MGLVRSRDREAQHVSPACCAPSGYRICASARGSPKTAATSMRWRLHSWELARPLAPRAPAAR
eukprot:2954125-Prymnesium_polylepis.2